MNNSIKIDRISDSGIIVDSVFGKYNIDNTFINWYINYENNIKDLFTEVLSISESNGIIIDDNDENFNTFIIMMYNESKYI